MQATEAVSSPDGNIMKKKTVKTSKTKNTSSSNRCIRPPEPEGFSEDGSDNYSLPRGITMRPSGKWQTQFYFAGQSRYIGVFASRFVACTAYEVVRNFLQTKKPPVGSQLDKEKASKIFRQARIAGHEAVGLEL